MDITKIGAQLLSDKLGLNVDAGTIQTALSSLLGDGSGNIDIAALVSTMGANANVGELVGSWLGDGANSVLSAEGITGLLGESNVADFARKIGTDTGSAAAGLADVVPQLIDKSSSGGNLLESAGGLLGMASSLLK